MQMTLGSAGKFSEDIDLDDKVKEPERDFDKLKARIKLKAIKKFTEDEKQHLNGSQLL